MCSWLWIFGGSRGQRVGRSCPTFCSDVCTQPLLFPHNIRTNSNAIRGYTNGSWPRVPVERGFVTDDCCSTSCLRLLLRADLRNFDRPASEACEYTCTTKRSRQFQTVYLVNKMVSEVRSSSKRPVVPELGLSCDEVACSGDSCRSEYLKPQSRGVCIRRPHTALTSDLRVAHGLMFRRF